MAAKKNLCEIVSITQPNSLAAEAYRTLRTNISMREFEKPIRTINIVSTNAQEAKTTTAVNLAAVYGQLGKKVLLIDLDLRLPSVHKKLCVKNKNGITDVLSKKCSEEKAIFSYKGMFDVLLSGSKTPYASEFIQSDALKKYLKKKQDSYDIIIIDCPPVNLVPDGLIASTYCDGTLFCIASGADEPKEIEKAKEALDNIGASVLGVVMTRMPENKKYYNKYGGKYGYAYTYGYGHGHNSGKGR